ncbi:rsbT co-antagonist protein RsbR [Granulicella aggregans]|uniref:RsbT co-antagonist protein RsbR n=1 Tax=Granulicella aggregans TaxID=474949 RepID=A0A7W8E2J2_9BACT|nr:STAS domain-containing protein [Granulicella aggregans]MBB5056254.1 rsbT co-antagonist protein RsbR [Granulicella aggregans]
MSAFQQVIKANETAILSGWLSEMATSTRRTDLMGDTEIRQQATELLRLFTEASQTSSDVQSAAFASTKEFLKDVAKSRMDQGFTPAETALFVLSMKQPVFNALRDAMKSNPSELVTEIWAAGNLLDKLSMLTVTNAIGFRELTIQRQQEEMLELSTPVVKLWDGILALPLIGTLDSARTQVVMESLLTAIVDTNSQVAIIDITGVPTVDTLVAQHLIKTITAARLMGADCYLSGIRPAIAQTIVHLGIDLTDIQTKAKLSDAFALALQRSGKTVVSTKGSAPKPKEL